MKGSSHLFHIFSVIGFEILTTEVSYQLSDTNFDMFQVNFYQSLSTMIVVESSSRKWT